MLLAPKKRKYRKQMVKPISGVATRGADISFGDFGLKAIESAYVSGRQIEAARKVIVRHTRNVGKLWIRVFPDVPITKKGLEMPMGKGKGDVDHYAARVKKGRILFEITGLNDEDAKKALISAGKKIGVKTMVVQRGRIK